VIESAARVPFGALIAMRWNSTCIPDHSGKMEQIPGHEGCVAIGKIIFGPARAKVRVTNAKLRELSALVLGKREF